MAAKVDDFTGQGGASARLALDVDVGIGLFVEGLYFGHGGGEASGVEDGDFRRRQGGDGGEGQKGRQGDEELSAFHHEQTPPLRFFCQGREKRGEIF